MFSSYSTWGVVTKSFSLVQNAFLQTEGLPFADVLSEEEIREAFVAENGRRRGTVREGLLPQDGHARFQGVGRFHSTREAGEQSWPEGGDGARGGKGIDQGKRPTNLTRTGHRAGVEWHRIAGRTRRH